jgi:hypothetical protein
MTDQFIASRKHRESGVIADGQRLGIEVSTVKAKPKDARIVRDGGSRIPAALLSGRPSGAYVLSEWRFLSGWSHGFQWPVKYTSPPEPRTEGERSPCDTSRTIQPSGGTIVWTSPTGL